MMSGRGRGVHLAMNSAAVSNRAKSLAVHRSSTATTPSPLNQAWRWRHVSTGVRPCSAAASSRHQYFNRQELSVVKQVGTRPQAPADSRPQELKGGRGTTAMTASLKKHSSNYGEAS